VPGAGAGAAGAVVVWALAAVSAGLGLFQLLRAGGAHSVLEYDDGVWFGSALRLADGALPYRDFVLDQPPGVPLLLAPVALLAHAFGAAGAFVVARLVTVGVEAANVVLVGRLLRARSVLAAAVGAGVVTVYPAAVMTARTVMLEPFCDLWCLIGLCVAFGGRQGATSARRAVGVGALFGVAGACKAFALLPFVVLVAQMALGGPVGRRRAALCSAAAAGCFAAICAPFVVLAPAGFLRQVVLTQIERGAPAMTNRVDRLAQLLGVPPAPSSALSPGRFETTLVMLVAVLVGLALVLAWRAALLPARSSLARWSSAAVLVTAGGLIWPAAFYYHYAAFLAPFLGLALGAAADALLARRAPAVAGALAAALVVVGTAHAVRVVQTTDPPGHPAIAWLDAAVPLGACAVSDNPSVLVLADRFAARPGCSQLVDADGSTLAWSGGKRGAAAVLSAPAVQDWLQVLRQTDYVVVTQGLAPQRIPWGAELLRYLRQNFESTGSGHGMVVWARRRP
jgi:hypothetical protein